MNLRLNFLLSNYSIIAYSILVCFFVFYCFDASKEILILTIPIALFGLIGFLKPDIIWFSIAFFTPLSINPADVDLGKISISFPTEPLLVLLIFLFVYYLFVTKELDTSYFYHPFSILLYSYLGWMLITSFTSVDKIVSIKFWIARLWFIIPTYFLGYFYFVSREKVVRYVELFLIAMMLVSLFNILHLSRFGFEDKPSQWTMQPFFKNHAVLGAINALCIPLSFGLISYHRGHALKQIFYFFILYIMVFCLIVTYSRAAYISIIPALLLYIALRLKVPFKSMMLLLVSVLIGILINLEGIIRNLETNKIASSDNLVENVESISNISTDASNLERINRWACAVDMWKTKPLFGFGPGTYMTEYAPFQLSGNYTEISTNSGDVGNSHSEYLGPLAEQGLLGGLLFLAILLFVIYYSFKVYNNALQKKDRIVISMAACALITYLTHGFLNNFLDMDKAAIPFWTLIGVLVTYDVKFFKEKNTINQPIEN